MLKIPDTAEAIARAAFGGAATPSSATPAPAVAFRANTWSETQGPVSAGRDLVFARTGDLVKVTSASGRSEPAKIEFASRATTRRLIAVPGVASNEEVVIDLAAPRPWGARPALVARDDSLRILTAYLLEGDLVLARTMARSYVRASGQIRPMSWAEPSFAQLLVGYTLALGEDSAGLAAWCRRTDAARTLGSDGLILAGVSALLAEDRVGAIAMLQRAVPKPFPVLLLGLRLGTRTAFQLASSGSTGTVDYTSLGPSWTSIAEMTTRYARLAAISDPESVALTIPTAVNRPLSLQGRKRRTRLAWSVVYFFSRLQYSHILRVSSSPKTVRIATDSHRQTKPAEVIGGPAVNSEANLPSPSEEGRHNRWEAILRYLLLLMVSGWALILALVVYFSIKPSEQVPGQLLVPLCIVQGGAFLLVGVAVTLAALDGRADELRRQVRVHEARAAEREEQALKGRALAAVIQASEPAQTPSNAPPNLADGAAALRTLTEHARVSRALFGDLLGETRSRPIPDPPA